MAISSPERHANIQIEDIGCDECRVTNLRYHRTQTASLGTESRCYGQTVAGGLDRPADNFLRYGGFQAAADLSQVLFVGSLSCALPFGHRASLLSVPHQARGPVQRSGSAYCVRPWRHVTGHL